MVAPGPFVMEVSPWTLEAFLGGSALPSSGLASCLLPSPPGPELLRSQTEVPQENLKGSYTVLCDSDSFLRLQ